MAEYRDKFLKSIKQGSGALLFYAFFIFEETSYFCVTKSIKMLLCSSGDGVTLFTDKKRGKSQQGGLAPSSFQTTGGVHELVARAMRGKCVRHMAE